MENTTIEELKKKRYLFLHSLWKLSGGNEYKLFPMWEIGDGLGFDNDLTDTICQYLKGEGLLETYTLGPDIGITHEGVREVEEALSRPKESTTHFPPVSIVMVDTMVNSQIQQGSPGSIQSLATSSDEIELVKEVLVALKKSKDELNLKEREISDLHAEIQTLEAQLSSSTPNGSILRESLKSILTILQSATASATATILIPKLIALVGAS